MKNSKKITLGMLGMVFMLLTVGCEKEPIDEGYEIENISEEKLLLEDAIIQQQVQNGESSCNSLIDLGLVIDVSGSMYGAPLTAAKNGAKSLVNQLNSTSQSALVSYSTSADRPFDLTVMDAAGQAALISEIDQLSTINLTNIQGGIIFAAEELTGNEDLFSFLDTSPSGNNRVDAEKVMILLSDGEPNQYYPDGVSTSASGAASEAANIAKAEGIRIITIAVDNANTSLMESLASSPDDAYTTDSAGLEQLFEDISGTICTTRVVNLDIHPTSCPNPLSLNAKGFLPVSINGSETLDVSEIDITSIKLEGISHKLSSIEDVSTFFQVNLDEPLDPYSCTTLGADGFDDLTLKFDYDELRVALGAFERDDVMVLEISGVMNDGTEFIGRDIVIAK